MAAVEPSVEVLKNLIENSGGRYYYTSITHLSNNILITNDCYSRVEIGDIRTISEIKNSNQRSKHSYIVVAGAGDDVQNLLEENIKFFSSDFVINSISQCDLDFQKNTLSS